MTRILHFTDAHLRWNQPGSADNPARLSREMPSILARLADQIPKLRPDAIVMTGDLLDVPNDVLVGAPDDGRAMDAWRCEIDADFQIFKDWFERTGVPWLAVPGNHDDEDAFRRVFGEPPIYTDIAGLRFFTYWDELGPDRQPHRSGARQSLFEAALTAPEHDLPQVHLQHYMIDPPTRARGWNYEYRNAAQMKRELDRSGRVRAILSGHYHPGSLAHGEDGLIHSLPPAFSESPHFFRLYDVGSTGEIKIQELAVV
ncbi:MAG: metallophosphoesterase [Alphaproteobacteria bacterium]|nr:metallophosphoesterase [Alphaproteobacteria bacterium]